ncbi:SDR family oxidoreductase [Candidatus Micrarchaeota archaeon]|nr:SDR family oxidoreductase [Candidatus Micrarchaeota archaeon]
MFNIKNKVVVITGGLGLLGNAFSMECARHGASVVIADLDDKKAKDTIERIKKETKNNNVLFQHCNITNKDDALALIDATLKKFGKIDALVNNAYPKNKNYGKKFEEVSFEDFCENINMHLGGYFLITKEVSKIMIKQNFGNVINLASIYGFSAPKFEIYEGTQMTMPVEYAAIKGAIINLTRYLAAYLGKYNIRVNSISPGGVFNDQPESFVRKYSKNVVLGGKMAATEDLTGILIFLLSDASKYMTGQNLVIDGGWTL